MSEASTPQIPWISPPSTTWHANRSFDVPPDSEAEAEAVAEAGAGFSASV